MRGIFDYETSTSDPHRLSAKNINGYLADAPDIFLPSRTTPPLGFPQMLKGSQPTDGGNLILSDSEKNELLSSEPAAEKFIKQYVGGDELINSLSRWCLWLKKISPQELRSLPKVYARVEKVREARLKSPTKSVQEFASFPTLFTQDRQPEKPYLAIPEVSSENRIYIYPSHLKSWCLKYFEVIG